MPGIHEECVEVTGIPNFITREHILRAIKEIARSGVPEGRHSRDYCLIFEDTHYPPKYVISQAAKYAIGRELGPHEFYGGECPTCANVFLRSRGFEVVECKCDRLSVVETHEIETTEYIEESRAGDTCCGDTFKEFHFENLVEAEPPKKKGIYVIRIESRSDATPEAMINGAKQVISGIGWRMLEKKTMSRIERLKKIDTCPIIYIGSAGTQRGSRNTLKGRYKEFSGRHTAMYPIWVLLYFGWKLQFGWKESNEPSLEEKRLKQKYRNTHQNNLPALVKL